MGLRCAVGGHKWFEELATFSSAERCERCQTYRFGEDGERIEYEFQCWADCAKLNMPYATAAAVVVGRMAAYDTNRGFF